MSYLLHCDILYLLIFNYFLILTVGFTITRCLIGENFFMSENHEF